MTLLISEARVASPVLKEPGTVRSGCCERLPILEALRDQLDPRPIVTSVHDGQIVRVRAQVNAGRPGPDVLVFLRSRRPVTGSAIGGLYGDLAGSFQLRRIDVQRPFSLPVVENTGRILFLL